MPNTTIQLKKSSTPSAIPSSLANGELAINFADGKLFYQNTAGYIAEISGAGGGGYSFSTVNANSTLIVSDTSGDILTIVPGNNITIVGDAINDKITIGLADSVGIGTSVPAANLHVVGSVITGKLQHSPVSISKLLTGFDTADSDAFGRLSISGDSSVLAVGAVSWEGAAGTNRGGVYIYDWNGSAWIQRGSILEASDAADLDQFGISTSLNSNGTILAVGALSWEGATGTNRGGVYIYDWNGSSWTQRGSVIEAADAADNDNFGRVSLNGDGSILAVSATGWEGATGLNRGGVYIYDWNGSSWTQRGSVIEAADAADNDQFGTTVSLSSNGTILAIGAAQWEGAAGTNRGGVYIYDWNGSSWVQRGSVLEAADAADNDQFYAASLSSDGTVLVVGATIWEGGATSNTGGVYIFDWNGSSWAQRGSVLEAPDAADGDRFGISVDLNSDASILVIAADNWEANTGTNRGAVYTYSLTGALPSSSGVATGSGWIEGANSALIGRTAGLDRITIDANGDVNIAVSATINSMNVVPTIQAAFDKANAANVLADSKLSLTGGTLTGPVVLNDPQFEVDQSFPGQASLGYIPFIGYGLTTPNTDVAIVFRHYNGPQIVADGTGVALSAGAAGIGALISGGTYSSGYELAPVSIASSGKQWLFSGNGHIVFPDDTKQYTAFSNSYIATINAAFTKANAALPNTSGVSFNGDLYFPSGNVGIGRSSVNYRLDVAGTINAANILINGNAITTLQGIQGLQGRQGIQGTQGANGFQGIQGTTGTQGIQGFDGGMLTAGSYVVKAVKNGSTQNVPNGTDTVVTLVDDFDPNGWWTPNKFQPTIAGYYSMSTQIWLGAGTINNNQTNLQLRKNGSTQLAIAQTPVNNSTVGEFLSISTIAYFNGTTDYVEVTFYTANPTSQDINGSANGTWFTAALYAYGAQGAQGIQGRQGIQGANGFQGLQGIQGLQGTLGIQGIQGLQGIQGTQGANGFQGIQGTVGSQGANGVQGIQGLQGRQGANGFQGIQGIQGIQGANGFQGIQGVQGIQGANGFQGIQGTQGLQGANGFQGLQGTQGLQGANGFQGIQGIQGIQGANGFQGIQGIQGIQGTTGSQGANGFQGIQGTQGTQGIQGIQGIQGRQGIQGIQGLQGIQGTTGSQGANGFQGIQGVQGIQGANGFQGLQGTQGLQGANGFQGLQGTQGLQGANGFQGLQGTQGLQGANGFQGIQGIQGSQGIQGLQGIQGPSGPSTIINATAVTVNDTVFPVFVTDAGSNQTAQTSVGLTFNPSTNVLSVGGIDVISNIASKLSLTGGTLTGSLSITGNLTVSGNTTVVNAENLRVSDPLIYLASNNYSSDIVDIGFIGNYVNATGQNVHTGLYREHADKMYYLFQGYDREPANNHIGALSNNMTLAVLNADIITSNLTLGGQNTYAWINAAFNKANSVATIQGIQGIQGTQGLQGLQGIQGSNGFQGIQGTIGSQGIQGLLGLQGITGPSTLINATAVTVNDTVFPVFVTDAGSNQTAQTSPGFTYNPSSNTLSISGFVGIGAASSLTDRLTIQGDIISFGDNYNTGTKALKFQRVENKAAIWSVPLGSFGQADLRFTTGGTAIATAKTEANATVRIAPAGGVAIGNAYLAQNPNDGTLLVSSNVGIGTTSPTRDFHVKSPSLVSGLFETTGTSSYIDIIDSSPNYLRLGSFQGVPGLAGSPTTTPSIAILASGNIGIGNTTPSAKLTVNGDILASGDIRSTSAGGNQGNFQASMSGSGAYLHMVRPGYQAWYLASPLNSPDFYISEATGTVADSKMYFKSGGNVGIGTSTPTYKLEVAGSFAAQTKSFVIDHQSKPNHKLRHGSLEGPENGVYVRGRTKTNVIELPEYWTWLIDEDSITVTLTSIGKHQKLVVEKIENNKVYIKNTSIGKAKIDCFYMINAERKDVDKLIVEY